MPEISKYYQPELTLPDLLTRASAMHPDLFVGYSDKSGNILCQTYQELLEEAKRIAAGLYNLGLRKSDKLIIATLTNKETIELLWGCFLLGVVPTTLQSPVTFTGINPPVVKLMSVFRQLEQPYIFMSPELKDVEGLPQGIVKHRTDLKCTGEFPEPDLKPDDLAFIQFSSGSTGESKGVMLTHRNMMVNMDAIRLGLDLEYPDVFGNWMPLFHDMGLIGYHLTPIYSMVFQYQLETIDFIMNPGLWLNLMSRSKVTISGCTNFGLSLVLRHFGRKKPDPDWDFSRMKALLNGAEPISVKTMKDFIGFLVPYGFKPETMMPVYGMAEATLAVSFAPLRERSVAETFDAFLLDREHLAKAVGPSDPAARVLSEVGTAINDIYIRIVDDQDNCVAEGTSGHIQLKGPSITSGYYNMPETRITAYCGEWLRTGDIGFFFEGRLYISGRHKDIIFRNGRHYFANDLEEVAITIDEIKPGKVCYGGVTDEKTNQDKVIAFLAGVPEQKAIETFQRLRALLRNNLGISTDEVVLLKSNEIPKTSSGKLQRYKLMQRYLSGEFADRTIGADKLDSL
ncbi:MAG: AMP-binding protein [Bacteroidota bacterium]